MSLRHTLPFVIALVLLALPSSAAAATCDRHADPSTWASHLDASVSGETICLATGDYGTFAPWFGKAVTITAEPGATPTMALDWSRATITGYTVDGLTIPDAYIGGETTTPRNLTIRNSTFTGVLRINGPQNSNILLDNNTHNDIGQGENAVAARIHLAYTAPAPSGVTVQNSTLIGGAADGIQTGSAMTILNNHFEDISEESGNCPGCHTDAIQLFCGCNHVDAGSTIVGNYIADSKVAIGAYDGTNDNYIARNVITRVGQGILLDDERSTIEWNTLYDIGDDNGIVLTYGPSTGQRIRNNITPKIVLEGAFTATPSENTNNMLIGNASPPNFSGTPVFIGGSSPTTYAGFTLTAGSPGVGDATDGSDVGVGGERPDHTPVAAFSFSPQSPTTGETVTFDASGSTCEDAPCTYHWHDVGASGNDDWPLGDDGETSTFAFQHVGSKYVELVLTDADGDVATVRHTVAVGGPPTLVATQETTWDDYASPKTTASFTVAANDVIVVFGLTEDQRHAISVSGGTLNWTRHQLVNAEDYARAYVWTATAVTNTTMSVSCRRTSGGSGIFGCRALVFRGSSGVGASAQAHAAAGTPAVELTTTQARSAIVVANADWSAGDGASRAWLTGAGAFTELTYGLVPGIYTVFGGYHADAGAAGLKTLGLSAPAQKYSIAAVEVKGT